MAFVLTYALVGALSGLLTFWMGFVSGYVRAFGWKDLWLGVLGAVLLGPFSLATNLRALWIVWIESVR